MAVSFILLSALLFYAFQHRSPAGSLVDPSGRYRAIISCKTYLSYLPMPPGSSSDKPCFVRIVDRQGNDYGEIPVPMLQMADVEWTDGGAAIKLIGEWDFKNRSCYYWSEDGNHKVYVHNGN